MRLTGKDSVLIQGAVEKRGVFVPHPMDVLVITSKHHVVIVISDFLNIFSGPVTLTEPGGDGDRAVALVAD
jgi:hypothetical protein